MIGIWIINRLIQFLFKIFISKKAEINHKPIKNNNYYKII